mgnify:CR=1 FL=1
MKRVAIITSSDMGYQGKREDLSGPAIKEIAQADFLNCRDTIGEEKDTN